MSARTLDVAEAPPGPNLNSRPGGPSAVYLRDQLLCAMYDSVRYVEPPQVKNPAPATKRHHKYLKAHTDRDRIEAREWFREGSPAHHGGDGFGWIWSMLRFIGSVRWEREDFVEEMEILWRAVDNDHELGKKIARLIFGANKENKGYHTTLDRILEFSKIREAA